MFLLRFILIFIIVVYILRLLGRLFFFSITRNYNTRSNSRRYDNYRKEGDVTIDTNSASQQKMVKKDIGDYINYEEVDN